MRPVDLLDGLRAQTSRAAERALRVHRTPREGHEVAHAAALHDVTVTTRGILAGFDRLAHHVETLASVSAPPTPRLPGWPQGWDDTERLVVRLCIGDLGITVDGSRADLRAAEAALRADARPGVRGLADQLQEGLREHEGESEGEADGSAVRHGV